VQNYKKISSLANLLKVNFMSNITIFLQLRINPIKRFLPSVLYKKKTTFAIREGGFLLSRAVIEPINSNP
jgi:hypothetical protein